MTSVRFNFSAMPHFGELLGIQETSTLEIEVSDEATLRDLFFWVCGRCGCLPQDAHFRLTPHDPLDPEILRKNVFYGMMIGQLHPEENGEEGTVYLFLEPIAGGV